MLENIVMAVGVFVVWYLGAMYGWNAHERFVRRVVRKTIYNLEKDIEESVVLIRIEKHNSVLYVYDSQTDAFMAQGKTRTEIETIMREKFPGKHFAAAKEDYALLGADK
jgi:hypothetical protein